MGALGSKPTRDRGEEITVRRTIIGFLITCALGGLCVAPLVPEAQPPTPVYRIGALSGYGSIPGRSPFLVAFLEGMRALGYVEGQPFVLEYRGVAGEFERFPALAAELVRLKVAIIVAQGTPAALAAKDATTTIPIVMVGVAIQWRVASSPASPSPEGTSLAYPSRLPNSLGNS
jgi:putative ABC transport system substrate-binding protein